MAYQDWSVVFGEQPSASKWNILGANDAGFNDGTGIGDDAILQRHIADNQILPAQLTSAARWWEELARTTRSTVGTSIDVSFTAKKYLMILFNGVGSGAIDSTFILNNDSGANYAFQYSVQHGAQTSGTAQSNVPVESGATVAGGSSQNTLYIYNPSGADKLGFFTNCSQSDSLTAANAPRYLNGQFMYNSNTQCTRFTWNSSGNFAIGSEVIVLGHD